MNINVNIYINIFLQLVFYKLISERRVIFEAKWDNVTLN